jgi:hypothetical protein
MEEQMKRNPELKKTKRLTMVFYLITFCCLLFITVMSSCVTGITMDEIKNIQKQMSLSEFKTQVKKPPVKRLVIEHEGLKYTVEVYPMQTGTTTQSQYVYNAYTKMGYTQTVIVPVYEDYFFLYKDDGLLFWGFMADYQKSDDELIQKLAPEILAEYHRPNSK